MSLLGFTSKLSLAACQAGIKETDAPMSRRTFVGGISFETDLEGTFLDMSRLYAGTELSTDSAAIE